MSARVSTSIALKLACSGAMYSGVPATPPKAVYTLSSPSRRPPVALARPKSITLGTGSSSWASTRMLEGFRSRWMIRRSAASRIPWATCRIQGITSSSSSGPSLAVIQRARSIPSTCSITRAWRPSGRVWKS